MGRLRTGAGIPLLLLLVSPLFLSCTPKLQANSVGLASIGGPEVKLAWNAVSGEQTGFFLQQSTDGVNYTTVQTLAGTATSATVAGLTAGTTYYFRLQAFNPNGNSAYTAAVEGTP